MTSPSPSEFISFPPLTSPSSSATSPKSDLRTSSHTVPDVTPTDRIASILHISTTSLDDLFRGYKDKAHTINTSYRELVSKEGANLETGMQTVVDAFISQISTAATAGVWDMAQIQEMCEQMKTNVLLQFGKHASALDKLKGRDKGKLDKIGKDAAKELGKIKGREEMAIKGVVDGILGEVSK